MTPDINKIGQFGQTAQAGQPSFSADTTHLAKEPYESNGADLTEAWHNIAGTSGSQSAPAMGAAPFQPTPKTAIQDSAAKVAVGQKAPTPADASNTGLIAKNEVAKDLPPTNGSAELADQAPSIVAGIKDNASYNAAKNKLRPLLTTSDLKALGPMSIPDATNYLKTKWQAAPAATTEAPVADQPAQATQPTAQNTRDLHQNMLSNILDKIQHANSTVNQNVGRIGDIVGAPLGTVNNFLTGVMGNLPGNSFGFMPVQGQPEFGQKSSGSKPSNADWFNIQPNDTGEGSDAAKNIATFDRSPVGIRLQALQRIGNPTPVQLTTMKSLQELRSSALANEKTGLELVKSGRERASDIGSYTMGSDDYKDLINKSNTLKKMDSVVQDLEIAKNKGDVKSVGAIGTELIGFLNKVQGQMVTQEQRETLNPLIQKVHGLFGLGAGETINPSNYPVMLNTIKAIRSELKNDLASYAEKPGANIPEDKKNWLYNNEIKPSGEKIDAPKTTIGGHDYAQGMDMNGNPVVIDPKTNIPYAIDKDGKLAGILMQSGQIANSKSGTLVYTNGNRVDHSTDRYATVMPLSPEYLDYNKFGFPKPNKSNSVKVDRLSSNGDTFDIIYNKSQRGDDLLEANALKLMNAMNAVNTKAEGGQEAQRVGNIVGGIGHAAKNIPVIGGALNSIGEGLSGAASDANLDYQTEMAKQMQGGAGKKEDKKDKKDKKSSDEKPSQTHFEMKKIDGKWQKVEVK